MRSLDAHSDVDAVRDATDLVQLVGEHISLRPKGREHVGLCPFHDDRSPSFAVVTHKGNAFYKCHACGAGGDVFDFVRNYHKMDFPEALRFLADRAGITLRPRRAADVADGDGETAAGPSAAQLREANSLAASFFRKVLESSSAGTVGRDICTQRGISEAMIDAFNIGLAPDQWDALHYVIRKRSLSETTFAAAGLLKQRSSGDGFYDAFRNRLIFPICNEVGQPVAFGARKINPEDEPKYLNSAESAIFQKSRTLYGLHLAKRSIIDERQVIVTEGYTDVIACHQAGVTNVVGTLGTALTRQHAKLLSRLCDTVVLLFDGDEAGQRAADRALEVFFAETVDVKICVLPNNQDPDDLLKSEGGVDRLRTLVDEAEDALEHKIKRFRTTLSKVDGLSAKQKRFEQFLHELAELGFATMQGVRRRLVVTQLADMLGVTARDVEQAMPARRRTVSEHDHEPQVDQLRQPESGPGVKLARRRAEHDLLAVVLFDPAALLQAGIAGEFDSEQFVDPAARFIAEDVLPRLQRGEVFTLQQLLGAHEHPRVKSLLTTLYLEGRRMCSDSETAAVKQLADASRALREHMEHEHYQETVTAFRQRQSSSEDTVEAVRDLLEKRRQQGLIAGAISNATRS